MFAKMSHNENKNVFIWKEPDMNLKEEVLSFVKHCQPTDRGIVVLHCDEAYATENSIPLIFYIYIKCRQFKVFQNEKLMFLNPKDFCQAAELCLKRFKSLQENEFQEESVVDCHEAYRRSLREGKEMHPSTSKLKEFVAQNNCIDIWQMLNNFQKYKTINHEFLELKFLILGATDQYIFKEVMSSFLDCESLLAIETPLHDSAEPTVTAQSIRVEEFQTSSCLESATEEYCKEIVIAFLSLLINSRNELALSKVMISPFINLSHEAFTHLKHLAVEKEMPMCQTAISYVTRVRLGGKGYAPPANCPMQPHLKCLELFVDTLNHLQTIMEEDLSPKSSIKKLINVLKKRLLKCSKLKQSAVEKVSEKLHSITERVLEFAKSQLCFSSTPQICQETLDILHSLVNYVNCINCWTFDPEKIVMQRHCKRTPINLPPLLGYFRSPEEESMCEENLVINEDSIVSNNSSLGYPPPLMSYFHNSDNSCSVASAATCISTPRKTNFKDCIKMNEPVEENEALNDATVNNCKRPILNDVANIHDVKTTQKKVKIAKTEAGIIKIKDTCSRKGPKKALKRTNLSKKFKLIEGQGKITSFFSQK